MKAKKLFDEGKVSEAIAALTAHVRDHPTDAKQRTFLFELLCFAGEFTRARKQLGVLARGNADAEMGAVLLYSALHAEQSRLELFQSEDFPSAPAGPSGPGKLNGEPFESISDIDPDIGPRLEVFVAGSYTWVPFEHIASVHMRAPEKLRDTLWSSAYVLAGKSFKGADMGEVLLPVIYPFSSKHPDEEIWLGRATAFGSDDAGREIPVGHKILRVDDREVPLLEVRSIEFDVEIPEQDADGVEAVTEEGTIEL